MLVSCHQSSGPNTGSKQKVISTNFLNQCSFFQAFTSGYYINAIDFLKVANQTMNQSGKKFDPSSLKVLKDLQRQTVHFNNQYITKKHAAMGTNFKVIFFWLKNFQWEQFLEQKNLGLKNLPIFVNGIPEG